jgi:UDP-2-acetamido-3-amino-2,3-dideoxy-glucuronate N-acetyltransferase
VLGSPARITGWMCECGVKLKVKGAKLDCPTCGRQYRKVDQRVVALADQDSVRKSVA